MDIDLDFHDRDKALEYFRHVRASRKTERKVSGGLAAHSTGVYFQNIPVDPTENLSTIDYKTAASRGYFKIDFLNVSVYDGVLDNDHIDRLMNQEPIWELLENDEFSDMLFQVSGHGSLLREMKPKTVEQLAAVLAMIRPAKRHLIGKDWDTVFKEIWTKSTDGEYSFKHSHAISYAMAVIVQMNLICEQLAGSTD